MKMSKKPIIIGGVVVVAIIVALLLFVNRVKTIDVRDYTKVSFDGGDGFGKAIVDIDKTRLRADFAKAAGIDADSLDNASDLEDLAGGFNDAITLDSSMSAVEYKIDKKEGLKNGDKVTIKFDLNNEEVSKYKVKFVGDTIEEEVTGLTEVQVVDPFQYLKYEFSDISPNLSVSLTETEPDKLYGASFVCDKQTGIKKGDKLTISLEINDEEKIIEEHGVRFNPTEKVITVDKVDEYVSDVKKLDKKIINSMKKQAKDVCKDYLAEIKDTIKSSRFKYEGYYFLAAKEFDFLGEDNKVIMVYSVHLKNTDSDGFRKAKVYFPVIFSDIVEYANGKQYVDLGSTKIDGVTDLVYGWFASIRGYRQKSKMKNDLVISCKSEYTSASVGL
ncbi:hypothetical protein [Eubacterium xylanophilum]|uniref:hypothetical protein n=1 Tax=Eubacterium xylanophilum TaxID=39497 RepID=UPI0004798205|nr:hypothetical protein [Eubacterium xylanophilum]